MTYFTSGLVGGDLTATPTTPSFAVGTRTTGSDGTTWVYVNASGAIAQYDFVGIDENYAAAPLSTAMAGDGWMVGTAQVAFDSADYGWVCLSGTNVSGTGITGAAADVALYTSGTAGTLTDSTTIGTKIDGVVFVTSPTTSAGVSVEVIMTYPKSNSF